jgi:hypothetical protein
MTGAGVLAGFCPPMSALLIMQLGYSDLASRREMLKMDAAAYRVEYQKILDNLNPSKVLDDLGKYAILLCWEAPGQFCHWGLVAEWLEAHLGRPVPEYREPSLFDNDNI